MTAAEPLRCPVCRAGFRSSAICSRCGADLEPMMRLAAASWRLRGASRRALREGDVAAARKLADKAQHMHPTPAGRSISLIAAWLAEDKL